MCFDTCDTNFYVKGYSCIMYFDTCDTNFYNGLQSRQSTLISVRLWNFKDGGS